jgi:hypothetical protein
MSNSEKGNMTSDLVMLIRRMVVRLRTIDDPKGNLLADKAMDYLRRKDLASGADILRDAPEQPIRAGETIPTVETEIIRRIGALLKVEAPSILELESKIVERIAKAEAENRELRESRQQLADGFVRKCDDLLIAYGTLNMMVDRLGGTVEGAPTSRLNFLQRIDELVAIESAPLPDCDALKQRAEAAEAEVERLKGELLAVVSSHGEDHSECPACEVIKSRYHHD